MVLSYTTIEPPIFMGHKRPGKVILDLGSSFDDFNQEKFEEDAIRRSKEKCRRCIN